MKLVIVFCLSRFVVIFDVVVDSGLQAGPIENCFAVLSNNSTVVGNDPDGDFCSILPKCSKH